MKQRVTGEGQVTVVDVREDDVTRRRSAPAQGSHRANSAGYGAEDGTAGVATSDARIDTRRCARENDVPRVTGISAASGVAVVGADDIDVVQPGLTGSTAAEVHVLVDETESLE